MKIFLLDAYALIYRAYYAIMRTPRINSKGFNTSTVMGFCNTLNDILQNQQPTHIAVAFDHGKTFRHEIFPDYKAQREETPEDIKASVPIIKDILEALRIPILQVDGFEADDIIGTLAMKADREGMDCFMVTSDKDYGQLVTDHAKMFRPRHGGGYETLGPKEICEKYDIDSTTQLIDMLGLMGDSADNYQGCPGVGEKTAAKLIKTYGSIEGLLENVNNLKGKMKEKVEAAVEDIKLSKYLATIRTDVPMQISWDDMKRDEPDESRLRSIFAELEFRSLADRMLGKKSQSVAKPVKTQKDVNLQLDLFASESDGGQELDFFGNVEAVKDNTIKLQSVENEDETAHLAELFDTKPIFAFRLKTTQKSPVDAELTNIELAIDEKSGYNVVIPANREEALRIVKIFKKVFESDKIVKVGHNIKFAIEVLKKYDINLAAPLWDPMIAYYLINPGRIADDDKPVNELLAEKETLEVRLKELGQDHLFYEMEMPLVPVLAEMEMEGVCLDTQALDKVRITFNERMLNLEKEIYELAGEEFNIASPKQVGDILFGKLQLVDKPKKTKTGQYQTSEEVLQALAVKHPVVDKILEHRGLKKLVGTYIDALPRLINPRTGRIHTTFNQCVTTTGRLSSSDPNLQNIPIRDENGKLIRSTILPHTGEKFFSADYSQIELRVMASLANDEGMIGAFTADADIHAATAAKIYKKDIDDVTKDERSKAKRANFGIIYGISAFGLAQNMRIERSEAKALIEGYFESFPAIKRFMEKSKTDCASNGYVETMYGRRRYLPDINSQNGTVRAVAERNAINAPVQGTAADIIKIAMIRIYEAFKKEGLKSKMILQVHDELNFSVAEGEEFHVKQIVLREMQNASKLRVPLVADCGFGSNWLEAH